MLWWFGSALSMAEFRTDKESSVLLKAEDMPVPQPKCWFIGLMSNMTWGRSFSGSVCCPCIM